MAIFTSRYARAFADLALEKNLDAGQVTAELHSLRDLLASNAQLAAVWESPSIPVAQKRSLLDAIVKRLGTSRWVRNFVAVLIDNRRIGSFPEIVRHFQAELDRRLGIVEAEVASARELTPAEKKALESEVARLTGSRVRASYQREPALLGGARVRVGSTIYDGSVRGQLRRLKEQLATGD